jgi:hypothetical protein
MSNSSSKRRTINLSLLALILLCLAFPFAAVSCQTPVTSISAEYTGWDMAFGGEPTLEVAGRADKPRIADDTTIPAQPLMIVTVLIVIAGLILLSHSRSGHRLGVAVGTLAAFFLVVNQITVHELLISAIAEEGVKSRTPSDLVNSRFGFWTTLLLALAVTGYNATMLVRGTQTTAPSPPVPPAS